MASKIERLNYNIVKQETDFEIRYYPKAIIATVKSEEAGYRGNSNNNFRRLAGYIFGGNKKSDKISMTVPVMMEKGGEHNKMSFVMPSIFTKDNLPEPNDSSVEINDFEEGYYAAIKFGGFAKEDTILYKENILKTLLLNSGYEITGQFKFLSYNAPWVLVGRENEVIVMVNYQSGEK